MTAHTATAPPSTPSGVVHSATLAINERIRERITRGDDIVHLAFGEAGLPVHPSLAETLARAVGRNDYPPVAGTPAAREAVAGYFTRRGVDGAADRVVLAPGSKALLYALMMVLPGDVVLPRPCWVSYAAQAALAGRQVIGVPIAVEAGGVPDPAALDAAVTEARAAGRSPGVLVLTLPDNPTGTLAGERLVREVCAVADRHGLVVVSDEIYADLVHPRPGQPPPRVFSPAEALPDRTVVTTGLSKRLALGGWRIGAALLPAALAPKALPDLVGAASEIWSALPAPMQEVAAHAFAEPAELREHVAASARLHGAVAADLHGAFTQAGAAGRPPQGAFYLYPDFSAHRERLAAKGIHTSSELAAALLDRYGIGVLSGAAFGDNEQHLTFRAASSLLYGRTDDERLTALRAEHPEQLPWVRAPLARVQAAVGDLLSG